MLKGLFINLFPTSGCDTGCSHCLSDSNMNESRDFDPAMATQIINDIKGENKELLVCLTGSGEPLLAPKLLEIVDVFSTHKGTKRVDMITSGFTEKDVYRKSQFESFIKRSWAEHSQIIHSFSLFHPTFPERLENAIVSVANIGRTAVLFVRMCIAGNNGMKTWQAVQKSIINAAEKLEAKHQPFLLGCTKEHQKRHLPPVKKFISENDWHDKAVVFESLVIPQWHVLRRKKDDEPLLAILIEPSLLEKIGRAKNIPFWGSSSFRCNLFVRDDGPDFTSLTIDQSGKVYPECVCNRLLGTIGADSLLEIAKRKKIFAEKFKRAVLTDKRMFPWRTRDFCTFCDQLVAERGIELK